MQEDICSELFSLAGKAIGQNRSTEEESQLLKQACSQAVIESESLTSAAGSVLALAVNDLHDHLQPPNNVERLYEMPQGLLRYYGPGSHTKYDDDLGFLCSGWSRSDTPATNFEELQEKGQWSVASLKSHMEKQGRPSDWISSSSRVSWVLERINEGWRSAEHIALLSTAKMERLQVLVRQSDLLLEEAGGKRFCGMQPNGVHNTSSSHYLAYGWIPKQCVIKVFTLSEFRDVCRAHNITPDTKKDIDAITLFHEHTSTTAKPIVANMEALTI
ncbi:MAG: hypothetical protein Q9169_004473 [Polycauliona sp. 2 TL-2023]